MRIERRTTRAGGIRIHYREAGEGPAMMLLHGWPQTSHTWRKVMPELARTRRVVAPDLRGMGDSDKPAMGYDVRTIAEDMRALARELGLERIHLVATDWGALVARRWALDHPGELDRITMLDMVPHGRILEAMTPDHARGAWHYFFNAVPDLPERLASLDLRFFLETFFRAKYHDAAVMEEALDAYVAAYAKPGALRGGFSYYRAMFDENRRIDAESRGRLIEEPVHCIWGKSGGMGGPYDVLAMWESECRIKPTGRGLDACGHYVQEEAPKILIDELSAFEAASR
jgi:pimeloyl-ACP methyl ester carboxylesterase